MELNEVHNIIANSVKNQFSSVIITVLILLWNPVLALAGQSSSAYPPTKQYLNITLPSNSAFSPILLFSRGERILVRVACVNRLRDIQVLKQNESGLWEPVGTTGHALTGNDGNFLSDAFVTSDGKIWVLAHYTLPSNSDLGGMFLLYHYDNEKWILTTPLDVEPARRRHIPYWDSGLHFFDRISNRHSCVTPIAYRNSGSLRKLDALCVMNTACPEYKTANSRKPVSSRYQLRVEHYHSYLTISIWILLETRCPCHQGPSGSSGMLQ